MGWIYLLLAALFEVGFAIAVKLMDGHRNLPWTITFYISCVLSLGLLQEAVKTVPIGTAYAIWTGLGGVGVATVGMIWLGEPATPQRIAFLALLVTALAGLKFTAAH